jgi:hypothetical protein
MSHIFIVMSYEHEAISPCEWGEQRTLRTA